MKIDHPFTIEIADFVIDRESFELTKNGSVVDVTKKELKILYLLASTPDKVQSRADIFKAAWEEDILVGNRTIDVHIRRLRAKIGEEYIKTVKGVGYQFKCR
jgi:two-component system alkaline phosphatase synthesis response regulator PhoP